MLIGNVGQEPVVRYLDSGVCVATFSLATTERGYTLQNGTQVPERTEWHNIVVWRKQAEFVEKYVHKGDKLYVEGKIQSRSFRCHGAGGDSHRYQFHREKYAEQSVSGFIYCQPGFGQPFRHCFRFKRPLFPFGR